jgi:hypothetical protein
MRRMSWVKQEIMGLRERDLVEAFCGSKENNFLLAGELIAIQMARAKGSEEILGFDMLPDRRDCACRIGNEAK